MSKHGFLFTENKIKPISPNQIEVFNLIPDNVIFAFNELISKNFDGTTSKVNQSDVLDKIQYLMNCERKTIFENNWINIDNMYKKAGWNVTYNKPSYDENFEAHWIFRKP